MNLPHLPALRQGKPYASLDQTSVVDCRTGRALASISQVNAGIIRKDLQRIVEGQAALKRFTTGELLDICSAAGTFFLAVLLWRVVPGDFLGAVENRIFQGLP